MTFSSKIKVIGFDFSSKLAHIYFGVVFVLSWKKMKFSKF